MFRVPNEATELLKLYQNYLPKAVIAGGFLRDTMLGLPPKDINIFVPGGTYSKLYKASYNVCNDMGVALWDFEANDGSGAKGINIKQHPHFVYSCTFSMRGIDYQINAIALKASVKQVVDGFDFNICRLSYDGDKIYIVDEFWWDHDNRTFTLEVKDGVGVQRSVNRFKRLQKEKFAGWKLRVMENGKEIEVKFKDEEEKKSSGVLAVY